MVRSVGGACRRRCAGQHDVADLVRKKPAARSCSSRPPRGPLFCRHHPIGICSASDRSGAA